MTVSRSARTVWCSIVALNAACWPVAVWAEPATYELDAQHSRVSFIGHSTLHDFTGTATTCSGRMIFDPDQDSFTGQAEVIVPVDRLDTGIAARDRAMRAMFDAEDYPDIRFALLKLTRLPDAGATSLEGRRYRLEGFLKVRAVEQPVTFEAVARITPEELEVSGEVPLTTTLFDLKPPSVLGVIRVRKDILVRFDSRWKRMP